MRKRLLYLLRYLPWLVLLLWLNLMSALLLWLSAADAFGILVPLIVMGTVLLFFIVAFILDRTEQRRGKAFHAFLKNPDLIRGGGLRGICGGVGPRDEKSSVTADNGIGQSGR